LPAKYDAAGNLHWSRPYVTNPADFPTGVAGDSAGNSYLTGYTYGSLAGPYAGEEDIFLFKHDRDGNLLWSRQLGAGSRDIANDVAVDGTGNAYITGYSRSPLFGPSAGLEDVFLAKYGSDGTLLWSKQFGTSNNDDGYAVDVDALGNVYVAGETAGSLGGPHDGTNYNAFLAKYDTHGTQLWARQFTRGDGAGSKFTEIATDSMGNAYVGGFISGSSGADTDSLDAFITKYDSAGNLIWWRQAGTAGDDRGFGVAIDAAGNPYLGWTSLTSRASFLTKFDSAGNAAWSEQFQQITMGAFPTGLALDGMDNIYVSGGGAFLRKFSVVPEPATLISGALALATLALTCSRGRQANEIHKA
jgi:hypothetical protein